MRKTILFLIIFASFCALRLDAKVHTRFGFHIGSRARAPAPVYVVPQRTHVARQPVYVYQEYPRAYHLPQPVYVTPIYVYPDAGCCSSFSIRTR